MIDADELLFDDENERKFRLHGISVAEVADVHDNEPRFYINREPRRATHVMLGPTFGGRMQVVPIERIGPGLWRPVTAFEPTPQQTKAYRSRR
ncbi:MAG: hypothetical protein ABSD62_02995 [Candidatus Limnocylindrales bacterium]